MIFQRARLLILQEMNRQRIDIAHVDPKEIDRATIDLIERLAFDRLRPNTEL